MLSIFQTRTHLPHTKIPSIYISRQFARFIARYLYTVRQLRYNQVESKLSRGREVEQVSIFGMKLRKGCQAFSLPLNGVCISRPRKSRRCEGCADVYTPLQDTRIHGRARGINKEVRAHTDGHARAHASTLAFLSHLFMSRVLACIPHRLFYFQRLPRAHPRAFECQGRHGGRRGNYPVWGLAGRAFRSYLRITRHRARVAALLSRLRR